MSIRELNLWMGLYNVEARERDEAQQRAEDKAKAEKLARGMRALG